MEQVAQAKCELLDVMGLKGIAVLNGDDEVLMRAAKNYPCRKVTFGFNPSCDIRLNPEEFPPNLSVPFQKSNALAAIAVAKLLDIPQEGVLQVLAQWTPPKGRLEVKKAKGFWIIDDTYNANPLSTRAALEFLRDFQTSGRRVAVLSDMLELGSESEKWHYRLGEQAACMGLDRLILTGGFAKEVQKGALENGMKPAAIQTMETHQEIIDKIISELSPRDAILVKGSRRMKMEIIVEGLCSYVLSSALSAA